MFGLDYSWGGVNTQSSLVYFFSFNKYCFTIYFMPDTFFRLWGYSSKKKKRKSYLLESAYVWGRHTVYKLKLSAMLCVIDGSHEGVGKYVAEEEEKYKMTGWHFKTGWPGEASLGGDLWVRMFRGNRGCLWGPLGRSSQRRQRCDEEAFPFGRQQSCDRVSGCSWHWPPGQGEQWGWVYRDPFLRTPGHQHRNLERGSLQLHTGPWPLLDLGYSACVPIPSTAGGRPAKEV